MATNSLLSTPMILVVIIAVVILVLLLKTSKQTIKFKQYSSGPAHQRYIPQFSPQMELDLRLPYRRFKQLYPHSKITYKEYKKIQMHSSFKRSLSSQQNRRMVR
ncbi:MAG: hypothetical protein FWG55_07360 [Candidatus Bathyarchaeota archaeon]|nr:hypothetical protein [Candidatus Termiticorpusculum sp.]